MVNMAARRPPRRRSLPYTHGGTGSDAGPLPAAVRRVSEAHRCALSRFAPHRIRGTRRPLLLHLQRILDRIEGRELDVVELALHLLDLADVDVLDDVAGLRIDRDRAARAAPWSDRDRAARAFPFHALHRIDQGFAVGLALGLI